MAQRAQGGREGPLNLSTGKPSSLQTSEPQPKHTIFLVIVDRIVKELQQLRVLLEGVCDPRRLPALVRDFIVFEDGGSRALVKKMAGYH